MTCGARSRGSRSRNARASFRKEKNLRQKARLSARDGVVSRRSEPTRRFVSGPMTTADETATPVGVARPRVRKKKTGDPSRRARRRMKRETRTRAFVEASTNTRRVVLLRRRSSFVGKGGQIHPPPDSFIFPRGARHRPLVAARVASSRELAKSSTYRVPMDCRSRAIAIFASSGL